MSAAIRSRSASRLVIGLVAAALTLTTVGAGTTAAAMPGTRDRSVTVTEREFSLTLSTTDFKPGPYTFMIHNAGTAPHSLSIRGPGVDSTAGIVPPGKTTKLSVTLKKGTYDLWCPVDNHRAMGMMTKISVK
ncbi:cupredoxin domain-containing protein [Nonomuraea aurantiaca]|jgi:plastocyanin|uniref:cupredoxin domain-containing protein n=1 Tax=Nonomuraea aurantiaca TaxID=2878562 RepID=UPI001CD9246E|nr:cupredoxin domain-containing protein [Nonomuraea aurantiaca]MCA2227009.1 cupredoxin domain-containing protein [Nonomuraea aurantiaca]